MAEKCVKFRILNKTLGIRILIIIISKFFLIVIPGLISVAFITLLERKVLGIIGYRYGPNKVSLIGILQPLSDAIKLANKQANQLSNFSFLFYYFSAIFIFIIRVTFILLIISEPPIFYLKFRALFLIIILGLNSLNSIIRGWRVFRKFSLIGRIRTVRQLISYESSLYFIFFFLFFFFSRLALADFFPLSRISLRFILPICFYIWVPSILGELNRTPFDFSEGERELVRGFNTEFGSSCFTLIFLAEYSNIIMFCLLRSFIFFKELFIVIFFSFFFLVIWIRGVLPRLRFDKLIMLAWKFYIPFLTTLYIFYIFFSL